VRLDRFAVPLIHPQKDRSRANDIMAYLLGLVAAETGEIIFFLLFLPAGSPVKLMTEVGLSGTTSERGGDASVTNPAVALRYGSMAGSNVLGGQRPFAA